MTRGFRHQHDLLKMPKFMRWMKAEAETPEDLLPWADPYIASLFQQDDSQQHAADPFALPEDHDTPPTERR